MMNDMAAIFLELNKTIFLNMQVCDANMDAKLAIVVRVFVVRAGCLFDLFVSSASINASCLDHTPC